MGSGCRWRLGIHELLTSSEASKASIKNRASTERVRSIAYESGMLSLKQDGIHKVLEGVTDLGEIRRVCIS